MKALGYFKSLSFEKFFGSLNNFEQGISELKYYLVSQTTKKIENQLNFFESGNSFQENTPEHFSDSVLNDYISPKNSDYDRYVFDERSVKDEIDKLFNELEKLHCIVIPEFEFKNYQLLKNINRQKTHFLFVKGKLLELLNFDVKYSIAVVGSRNVRDEMIHWFDKNIPSEARVVVSGLANGSDINGHRVAMEHKKPIIVFPGYPINQNPSKAKMDVWNYAIENGLIISSEVPFKNESFFNHTSALLLRNDQMAEVTSQSFVLDFKNDSGTHWHLVAASIRNKIVMSKIVFEDNSFYLKQSHEFDRYFKYNKSTSRFQLLDKIKVI